MKELGRVYALIPIIPGNGAKTYIGSYKLTNTPKDDTYFGSCLDPRFLADRSRGKLMFIWLTGPIALYDARNIERQLLSYYDAMNNSDFYNSSNGGGEGVDSSYRCEETLFNKMLAMIEGREVEKEPLPVNFSENNVLADTAEMEALAAKVKSNQFPIVEVSVATTNLLEKTQPRQMTYVKQNLQELDKYFADPAKGRRMLTPIVIIVNDETGEHEELVEGNHRLRKAVEHKWVTMPAVLLKRSLFKNKRANMMHFGNAMNEKEFVQAGNSIEDLQKRIRILAEGFPNVKATSEKFKLICIDQLNTFWTESSIRYYCDQLEKERKENKLKADLNHIYYDKSELSYYGRAVKYNNPTAAVEVQKIDRITNTGFGGILSMMATGKKKTGVILAHYPSATMLLKQKKHINLFNTMLKYHGLEGKIKLIFLDPFNKGQILDEPPKTK